MNKKRISLLWRLNLKKVLEKDYDIDKSTSFKWSFKDESAEAIIQDFYPDIELTAFYLYLD